MVNEEKSIYILQTNDIKTMSNRIIFFEFLVITEYFV